MKTFVVSDLHGQGNVYDAMINYLSKFDEKVKLYILGDIIDRGDDSIRILLDVIKRDNIDITLLAGNHELFLYEYLTTPLYDRSWLLGGNGGEKTMKDFSKLSVEDQKLIKGYIDNLPINVKLDGIGNYENIYLGHGNICGNTDLKLKDINDFRYDLTIFNCLWSRNSDDIGIKNSLNVIGHTPVFYYGDRMFRMNKNVLNIDGGCSGMNKSDKLISPLVEIDYENDCLNFIGFNREGRIVDVNFIDCSLDKNKTYKKNT